MAEIGKIQPVEIVEEMQRSYLDYAMSVIVARALPDVRDGLKPVQRRIIYAMQRMGLTHGAHYSKSAKVVGEVLGKYHPHGDAPVYEALVRMAQDFSLRYQLIDGQGNFGCFTKDTKVKLTDGRSLSFGKLIKENAEGKKHWTFTLNPQTQRIEIAQIQNPRLTRKNAQLLEVTLDNNTKIRCTPDHRFILRTGEYKEARKLKKGESLMPLYKNLYEGEDKNLRGYEQVLQPLAGAWEFIHHLADKWNLKKRVYPKSTGRIRHHLDFNKLNNNPDNIKRMHWGEHWRVHYQTTAWRHKNDPEFVRKLAEGRKRFIEDNREILSMRASKRNSKLWQNSQYRGRQIIRLRRMWENSDYKEFMRKASSANLKKLWQREDFQKLLSDLKSQELKKRWQDKSYYRNMQEMTRQHSLKLWSNPNHRKHMSNLMKTLAQDPKWKKRQSKITKGLWQNPEYKAKFSNDHFRRMAKTLWASKEFQTAQKERFLMLWRDPNFRQKHNHAVSKSNKNRMQKNPNMIKELTQKAKVSLRKNWQDQDYKERVIRSNTLRYANSLLKKYPAITPEIYEKERKNAWTPKINNALKYFKNFPEIVYQAQTYNHKVVSIKSLSLKEDVYDLTVEPWHNFALDADVFVHNSIDGDPPAAMRYTESRLQLVSEALLYDLDKNTVDWIDNFDGSLKEPVFLPAVLPNLLVNGASGIAVGMATNIPPHNLGEIVSATIHLIDKPEASVEDLLQYVRGPDFPTGAQIFDQSEITAAYAGGRGKIIMRARAEIEEGKGGRFQIIVSEIPYQVNKAALVTRIAELARAKKLEGIADLRDESDRKGLRVVIELKRDARPQAILNNLYKHTALQQSFPVNMVALVNGVPQTLTLKMILSQFILHRKQVITRRSQFELDEAKKHAHILKGLKIAVDNIDAVIATIKKSRDAQEAKVNLMQEFKLTEIQALAILDMQLKRLAALERAKIEEELKMTREQIAYLEDLLAHPEKIATVVKDELVKLREKFGDERRTRVFKHKVGEFSEEDLIPNEPTIVTITQGGYVKRQDIASFRTQRRGGRGIAGITTKEEDVVAQFFATKTHDNLLFFTNRGRVFQLRVYDLPESSRISKGVAIVNLLDLGQEEKVLSILPVGKQVAKQPVKDGFVLMATRAGVIKKTAIGAYEAIRRSGIIAIKLTAGDQLRWAKLTTGSDLVFLVSKRGMSIKFSERDVRPMARDTMGVRGIKLKPGDELVGMDVIARGDEKADLLVITDKGIGKKTQVSGWPHQLRGGVGVKAANLTEKTGDIVCAQILTRQDEGLILTSQKGQVMRTTIRSIPRLTRDTQGVIVMRLTPGDKVAAATVIAKKREEEETITEIREPELKAPKKPPTRKSVAKNKSGSPKSRSKKPAPKVKSKPRPKPKTKLKSKLVIRKLKRR